MPKILKTIAPVDSLSGMFGNRGQNETGKALIANVRKKGNARNGGRPYMYFSVLSKTTYKGTTTQLDWATRFGNISKIAQQRMKDPAFIADDMKNFAKQTKYKTLYQYVWAQVKQDLQ